MEAERPSWFHDYAKDEEDGHRISELSAHIHAATAELALLLADYDESEAWAGGSGFRSVAHWMSQETGFDLSTAHELLKVGQAMKRLPLLAKAFRSGELSLDKARAIARVAEPGKRRDVGRTGETDGRGAADSGSARIPASDGSRLGRASRTPPDRRGVWFNWLDDGMLTKVGRPAAARAGRPRTESDRSRDRR